MINNFIDKKQQNILYLLITLTILILLIITIFFNSNTAIALGIFMPLFLFFLKKPELPLAIQFVGTILYFYVVSKLGMSSTTSIMTGLFHSFLAYSYILGGFLFNIKYNKKIFISLIDLLFLIFFFIIFISYLFLGKNAIKIQYAPLWVFAPYFGIQLLQSSKKINYFIGCCVLMSILQMILSFYELILNPMFKKSSRFSLYFLESARVQSNPILYAMTFSVFILVILVRIYEGNDKSNLYKWFLLIPSSFLLLRAGSRGILTTTVLTIIIYLLFFSKINKKKIYVSFFIILFFLTFFSLLPKSTRNFYLFTIKSMDNPGTSFYIRLELMKGAINDFASNPFFGIGTGNSAGGYGAPHYLLLEVLAEWGVFGGIIFLSLLFITIKTAIIFLKTESNSDLLFLMKLSLILFLFFTLQGLLFGGYITTYTPFFVAMSLISVIGKLGGKPICL